jgi:hypothetical protein
MYFQKQTSLIRIPSPNPEGDDIFIKKNYNKDIWNPKG